MADFASISDLEARPGVAFASQAERDQAVVVLGDVSELIRNELPLIDQWITDLKVTARMARMVCCEVTKRILATAETGGQALIGEQHPEYGYTLARPRAQGYELTDNERQQLTPQTTSSAAWSITPGFTKETTS